MHRTVRPVLSLLVALVAVGTLAQVAATTAVPWSDAAPPSRSALQRLAAVEPAPRVEPAPEAASEDPAPGPVPTSLGVVTDARWAVAVRDARTGRQLSWGDPGTFNTASVVKVDVLVALLLRAQDAGRPLTSTESALATAMIAVSDNDATTTLLGQVGGPAGVEAMHERLGLAAVDVAGVWGLTRTTAAAQLDLLAVVTGDHPGLDEAHQAFAQQLMRSVVPDQRFGVPAAADDPATALVKVGYLPRSQTGRWDVTSVGVVEHDGDRYLVSVLTEGTTSREAGAALTDMLAVAAVRAIARI